MWAALGANLWQPRPVSTFEPRARVSALPCKYRAQKGGMNPKPTIRTLIVAEDLARQVIREMLAAAFRIEIVESARTGSRQ